MMYQVVFEWHSEDSAMSDVYHCRDEQQAQEKFAELRDSIMHAVDTATCEVTDEPTLYSAVNRDEGIMGYVRILMD